MILLFGKIVEILLDRAMRAATYGRHERCVDDEPLNQTFGQLLSPRTTFLELAHLETCDGSLGLFIGRLCPFAALIQLLYVAAVVWNSGRGFRCFLSIVAVAIVDVRFVGSHRFSVQS